MYIHMCVYDNANQLKVKFLFPTCQVRVSRFYQRYFLLPSSSFFLLLPASDLNRELQISLNTTGLQLRAPDLRAQCRALIATCGSQWAMPDTQLRAPDLSEHCRTLNGELQISAGTARPQPRALDLSGQCPCQIECQNRMSDGMAE